MSEKVHKGGCAYGDVRFEARGEPHRVGVCHCLTCRKVHGAPFKFYVVFPADAVSIAGEVLELGARAALFLQRLRHAVYSHYGRPDEIDLYRGSFDEPGLFQPSYELWTSRREKWLPDFPTIVRRYAENRRAWRRTESD